MLLAMLQPRTGCHRITQTKPGLDDYADYNGRLFKDSNYEVTDGMAKLPNSVDEVVYFTRRTIGEGKVVAWVYKQKCPKCGKAMMGKPKDSNTGKVQIR